MPPSIVFINVPGDKGSVSQRDQELQAAEARAHAARVSRRPIKKNGLLKNEASSSSQTRPPPVPDPRSNQGRRRRRARIIVPVVEQEQDRPFDEHYLYALSNTSLGQGQVDPFDSAPVSGLDNFVYSILDFAYDYAFPSFVPAAPTTSLPTHRANRRKLGRQFGYLLEAQIVAAAKFQMSPMIALTGDSRRRVQAVNDVHERRAVALVNWEVEHLTTLPPDTLIYASALLAYISGPSYDWTSTRYVKSPLATAQNLHAMGHLDIVPERVQAVRNLIQLRGGIDELTMPFQRIVLTYLDTIVSTRLGVRPGWSWPTALPQSLQRTGEHILDHAANQLMQVMGCGFSEVQHVELRQTLLLMCEVTVALDHCHRGGSSPPAIWAVVRMRVAVQHRLCTLEPNLPHDISVADIQYELCRLSAHIYGDLVLFPIPEHSSIRPRLLYELGQTLDRFQLQPGADRDLLAWCVMLAAAASISDTVYRSQYVKRLEFYISRDVRLLQWDFYSYLLRRYLWWDYLLDPLAWEAFTAVSWQDIDNLTDGRPPQ